MNVELILRSTTLVRPSTAGRKDIPGLQEAIVREVQELHAAELTQACDIFDVHAVPERET